LKNNDILDGYVGQIITSFKMSPSSLGGGEQTTTAGEHISQLVETLIGRFFF